MPVLTEAKVPLVGPFTGAELLRAPVNRYIFNVRASYYDETEKIVEQLVSTGNKKIAVFYQDDNYGNVEANCKGVWSFDGPRGRFDGSFFFSTTKTGEAPVGGCRRVLQYL